MKVTKIILTIFTLAIFTSILPKIYFDNAGQKPFGDRDLPVLDVCIILDRYFFSEETKRWKSTEENNAIFEKIIQSISSEEVTILSSNLIRTIINSKAQDFKKILDTINKKDKWLNFATRDYQFVILIPIKKYPIKNIDELEKIGISKKILIELDSIPNSIDSKFYTESRRTQRTRIDFISSNEMSPYSEEEEKKELKHGLIELDSLLKIFSETTEAKKIMKRILLIGHGDFSKTIRKNKTIEIKKPTTLQLQGGIIAQLQLIQYITFLNKLSEIGCSFLYILSCYASGLNALACQNDGFYEQKEIFKKFESITKNIPFIIAIESNTDSSIWGQGTKIGTLFIEITKFFEKQRKSLIKYLTSSKANKIDLKIKAVIKNEVKNASEIDILSGKFVNKMEVGKTGELEKTKEKITLIKQQPWITKSLTEAIFESKSNEFLALRFPGKPFFRTAVKSVDKILAKKIVNKLNTNTENIKLNQEYSDLCKKYPISVYENIEAFLEGLEPLKNKINALKTKIDDTKKAIKIDSLVIDYPLLLELELQAKKIDIKTPETNLYYEIAFLNDFEYINIKNVLIYPSVVNLKININKLNNFSNFISMIPGQAQHYIDSINIKNFNVNENMGNIIKKFYALGAFDKLYFIKNISTGTSTQEILATNVAIKIIRDPVVIKKSKIFYIYKDVNWHQNEISFSFIDEKSEKYEIIEEKLITEDQAKKTIKDWILETIPAREAIYEATAGAGMENIYTFRRKISNIKKEDLDENGQVKLLPDPFFKDMFNSYELGKITKKENAELSKLTSEIMENVKKK